MFYEPLTIFYRSARPYARLAEFAGQRIAIGAEGSGTRVLALRLLAANGIEPGGPTQLVALEGEPARRALLARQMQAIFLSGDSAGHAARADRRAARTPRAAPGPVGSADRGGDRGAWTRDAPAGGRPVSQRRGARVPDQRRCGALLQVRQELRLPVFPVLAREPARSRAGAPPAHRAGGHSGTALPAAALCLAHQPPHPPSLRRAHGARARGAQEPVRRAARGAARAPRGDRAVGHRRQGAGLARRPALRVARAHRLRARPAAAEAGRSAGRGRGGTGCRGAAHPGAS
jgi:hypothetical protein